MDRRIKNLCNNYKSFIDSKSYIIIESSTSTNIPYMNYLIFAVWFCSKLNIPLENMNFEELYPAFKHLPFHSFLVHIKCQNNLDV